MRRVKAYACDYCNMTSFYASNVQRHERSSCRKNKARKTCLGCVNLDIEKSDPETGAGHIYCEAFSEEILPYNLNVNTSCSKFERLSKGGEHA